MQLTPPQRADILRYAIKNTLIVENGLYYLRLAAFDALEGGKVNPDEFVNFFVALGEPVGGHRWEYIDAAPAIIEADTDGTFNALKMIQLLVY